MKHIATIFLVLLFGSLTISSTTQELRNGKNFNDDGRSIRLKRNSKDDSLDEIMSLMETVQLSISVLATRQNEALQKIDGIETKVTDWSVKQERTESNFQTKIANLIAKHDEFLPNIEQVTQNLEAKVANLIAKHDEFLPNIEQVTQNLEAKVANLIAKHDEFLPNIEQVTQNLEAKVAILPSKIEAIQTKLSAIEAQIGRVENSVDTKMSSLNSTIMRKMESLKTELNASVINNGNSITTISREQKKLQLQAIQVAERLESMNFSLLYQVEKQSAADDRQLMLINSSLHFKLDEFKTDMDSAAMNATLFNTQVLNSFEKLNNISLVLQRNGECMNASIQNDRSKLTTQEISNLNLILSADDLLPLPSIMATKFARGDIWHTNEWVVIQRRGTPLKHGRIREEFKDRNWDAYARGFGKIDGDYWIDLEAMHLLNSAGFNQLRVDLEDWEGNKAYAEYDAFALSAASDKYRISISGYSGNAGNSFYLNNGSQFSTKDQDHDTSLSTNYAANHGPWWFPSNGGNSWLNAQYQITRLVWTGWNGGYSVKKAEMKLRRRQ